MTSITKYIKENYKYILFLFFFSSIFSCFLEFLYSIVFRSKIVKPGALFGLWCPIYGVTAVILLLLVSKDRKKLHNFFIIFLVSGVIEYLGSYLYSKLFNYYIWDYSDYLFNINGRVCLSMTLCFSILGYLMIYKIEPYINRLYKKLGNKVYSMNIKLLFLFLLDIFLNIISKK